MFSKEIWDKSAQIDFLKNDQMAQARRASAICCPSKIHDCWFIPNCMRKKSWDFMLIVYKQKFRNLPSLFGSPRILDFKPVVHASWLFLFLELSSNPLFSLPVRHFVSLHFRDFPACWICACLSVITQVALESKGSRNSLPGWLDSPRQTPRPTSSVSLTRWRRKLLSLLVSKFYPV